MSVSEQHLRVAGVEGRIEVEGTEHALGLLNKLIGELLDDPEETVIQAVFEKTGARLTVRKIKE